jgi:hypothetical protein
MKKRAASCATTRNEDGGVNPALLARHCGQAAGKLRQAGPQLMQGEGASRVRRDLTGGTKTDSMQSSIKSI